MNAILLKIQKNSFLSLLPLILLFSLALAFLGRSIIILIFNPPASKALAVPVKVNTTETNRSFKPVNEYESMVEGDLIRGKIITEEEKNDKNAEEKKQVASLNEEGEAGADDMYVNGCVAGSYSFARVAIKVKGETEAEEFALGDNVFGYLVKGIFQHYVVLDRGGVALRVDVGQTVGDARKKYLEDHKDAVSANESMESSEFVKRLISRQDIIKNLQDQTEIYKDAQFGPNLVNGKMDGYQLFRVGKKNLFYSFGARSGDLVKRVNGMPLNDTGKMFEIYNSIKTAPKIVIDLERKGKIITYEFTVRE